MIVLVLLFLIVCTCYYLYIKNHRHLSFGLGCLFFLWYGWYTSYSAFIFTHEPIIITSTTSTSTSSSSSSSLINSIPQQQHHFFDNNDNWPITIDTTQTNIQFTDIPLITQNKNIITINFNNVKTRNWAQSLNGSGLWSDIDYTTGCSASQINWQAKTHLERIESMASVWYHQQQDHGLLSKIIQSLDYWFLNDYIEKDCLMYGGKAYKNCPCGSPGLWNQAWHYQGIDIPRHIGNICLLIYQQLSTEQQAQCIKFTSRSYSLIQQYNGVHLVEMAYNGVSLALLKNDTLLLQDALDRMGNQTTIASTTDGIQMDGSYLSLDGQLNNGYDGESYLVNVLTMSAMMVLESKTLWCPSNDTMTALATLVSGSEWMMIGYNNTIPSPWLWQHSAINTLDDHTNHVLLNITLMDDMIRHWSSINTTTHRNESITPAVAVGLGSTIARLNHTYTSANQGPLVGTRYFWNADYLVHRCHGFVTTLKMIIPQTSFGCDDKISLHHHINYGSVFTYQQGSDYLDVFGGDTWDWNHVPGSTIGSSSSNDSNCDESNEHAFVGATVLEQNQMGVAVMNFTDGGGWQKTFFFFPSLYAIDLDLATSTTNTSHETILDQRQRHGDIFLNGKRHQQPYGTHQGIQTLWHDKILYTFETPINLTMMATGNGIWTASIVSSTSLIYTVQPNYGIHRHQTGSPLDFIINKQGVRGAFSASNHALALAFWAPGSINVPWSHSDDGDDGVDVFLETYHPLVIFLQQQLGNGTWVASISDPTKSLTSTSIKISVDQEEAPIQYDIDFPQGQMRGSSVKIVLQDEP